MKVFLIILCLLVVLFAYHGVSFYLKFATAQKLIGQAVPFATKDDDMAAMLVLGDSTAVGVGADKPQDTVPGLLAAELDMSVENRAVSGARVADLRRQIGEIKAERYDLVLVMIGANDVIRFASPKETAAELKATLSELPPREKLVVVLSAGNVGGARLFPWFIRPFHTSLNLKYHQEFRSVVEDGGGRYVNLYESPETDPFVQEPSVYLAPDGLHPSTAGYAVWLKKILEQGRLQ